MDMGNVIAKPSNQQVNVYMPDYITLSYDIAI